MEETLWAKVCAGKLLKGRKQLFSKSVTVPATELLWTDQTIRWGSETQLHSLQAEAKCKEQLQAKRFWSWRAATSILQFPASLNHFCSKPQPWAKKIRGKLLPWSLPIDCRALQGLVTKADQKSSDGNFSDGNFSIEKCLFIGSSDDLNELSQEKEEWF